MQRVSKIGETQEILKLYILLVRTCDHFNQNKRSNEKGSNGNLHFEYMVHISFIYTFHCYVHYSRNISKIW